MCKWEGEPLRHVRNRAGCVYNCDKQNCATGRLCMTTVRPGMNKNGAVTELVRYVPAEAATNSCLRVRTTSPIHFLNLSGFRGTGKCS